MAFRSTIRRAVNVAFKAAVDMATTVTFTRSAAGSFDFATGRSTPGETTTLVLKGILLDQDTNAKHELNRTNDILIVKKSDIGDVSVWDSFVIGTKRYNIKNYTDNDFTVEFILTGAQL